MDAEAAAASEPVTAAQAVGLAPPLPVARGGSGKKGEARPPSVVPSPFAFAAGRSMCGSSRGHCCSMLLVMTCGWEVRGRGQAEDAGFINAGGGQRGERSPIPVMWGNVAPELPAGICCCCVITPSMLRAVAVECMPQVEVSGASLVAALPAPAAAASVVATAAAGRAT